MRHPPPGLDCTVPCLITRYTCPLPTPPFLHREVPPLPPPPPSIPGFHSAKRTQTQITLRLSDPSQSAQIRILGRIVQQIRVHLFGIATAPLCTHKTLVNLAHSLAVLTEFDRLTASRNTPSRRPAGNSGYVPHYPSYQLKHPRPAPSPKDGGEGVGETY